MDCTRLNLVRGARSSRRIPCCPIFEDLESRTVPSATGNAWPHPELVTLGFVPDGTLLGANSSGNVCSSLFSKMNSHAGWTTATWQDQIIKAAQTWAASANINLDVISDSGAATGSGNYQQGDPTMADIRIGAYAFGNSYLASAFLPPPVNNYSIAGDLNFNTGIGYNIGTTYDLYSVALHELGHALGLGHSTVAASAMYPTYNGVKSGLGGDDVATIQSVYGARHADAFDNATSNGTFATASNLTSLISPTTLTWQSNALDITNTSDVDYYTFTVPAGTSGTLQLSVQTQGLSLLRQAVTVYASNETTVLGSASSAGAYDGTTKTITVSGVTAGQVLYVKVAGADTTAFGTGRYALTLNLGSGASPGVALSNTATLEGSPLQGGGSQTNKTPQLNLYNAIPGYETLSVAAHKPHHAAPRHHPTHRPTHHGLRHPGRVSQGPDWDAVVQFLLSDSPLVKHLNQGRLGV